MTSHVGRLYALALALLVFFLTWALVAARPWAAKAFAQDDPRLAALAAREEKLRRQSELVRRIVGRRWALYRRQLAARKAELATATPARAPSVRVVNLPPITVTKSS